MAPSPTVTFRVPPDLKAKCEVLAAAEGRTLSNWILRQLERTVLERTVRDITEPRDIMED